MEQFCNAENHSVCCEWIQMSGIHYTDAHMHTHSHTLEIHGTEH